MRTQADMLKERTQLFAESVVKLIRDLPNTLEGRRIGGQLFDAATSVAANYRAACKARSHAEFIAKIGIVVEEADESEFWLNFIARISVLTEAKIARDRAEASELTAIFTASHKTASAHKTVTNLTSNCQFSIDDCQLTALGDGRAAIN
jgi:four helix bundle protein